MTPAQTQRNFQDANVKVSKALPAAAATNYSDPIDLGSENPGLVRDKVDLVVNLPATPALVDAKTVTLAVQDSADGTTFAAIPELAPIVATGASGAGAAAIERRFSLPPTVRRYIRVKQDVLAAGGDNTAVSVSIGLRF
jgi:hypothetical protein